MIRIPKRVENLMPYMPGKPIEELIREKKLNKIVKLASNENPLGPSPKAVKALSEKLWGIHRYVDPSSAEMVGVLSKKFNKKPGQLICGNGVDSLLAIIIVACSEENDEILTSSGSFIGIYVHARKLGRKLTTIELKNYAISLDDILSQISDRTRIIYLANPNNPTGSIFTKSQFESFMQQVPENVLVILDEAYTEYATLYPEFPNGLDYDFDNLIVTRSLSKIYGLAGLRFGFAAGPDYIVKELYKVKLPFEPNCLAQVAAAAALEDDEFLQKTLMTNKRALERMLIKFDELGIKQVKSFANFILLLMPSEKFAFAFYEECLNSGLIVRPVKSFGIPNGIRINTGTEEETTFALEVIEKVYKSLLKNDNLLEIETKI
jgi:histidinol-phosphate aminotransferase